jgi:hypothetical protein
MAKKAEIRRGPGVRVGPRWEEERRKRLGLVVLNDVRRWLGKVVLLVGRSSAREMSMCIFRWEGELESKDDEDKPAVWLSQAIMSRYTCQVGLLRSRWFGGCGGVFLQSMMEGIVAAIASHAG